MLNYLELGLLAQILASKCKYHEFGFYLVYSSNGIVHCIACLVLILSIACTVPLILFVQVYFKYLIVVKIHYLK